MLLIKFRTVMIPADPTEESEEQGATAVFGAAFAIIGCRFRPSLNKLAGTWMRYMT